MLLYAISAIMTYLVISFVLTGLYVRFCSLSGLTKFVRKRFYLFPFIPLAIIGQVFFAILMKLFGGLPVKPRRLFEKISGKRTYKRKRYTNYRY